MNAAARLTVVEAVIAKLAARRGDRVSDLMRAARARLLAGEPPPPPALHDVAELEREARGSGLRAAMAKAQLRVAPKLRPSDEEMAT